MIAVADSWFVHTVLDGSLLLAVPVAMLAGLVSFFSPCVIPLLPGYLSYVTGLGGAESARLVSGDTRGARRGARWRMALGSTGFVLGFSVVFVAWGAAFGQLGYVFLSYRDTITTVLSVLIIVLGLVFAGVVPWLQREARVHRVPRVGLAAAPMLGVLFGFGWTPCIGPTLGAVTSLSASTADAGRGALLAFVYCLGLGVPFVLAGLGFGWMSGAIAWMRARQVWVMRLGGAMMVAVGVLLLTGAWDALVAQLQQEWIGTYETAI